MALVLRLARDAENAMKAIQLAFRNHDIRVIAIPGNPGERLTQDIMHNIRIEDY